jgi:hypothetical protein
MSEMELSILRQRSTEAIKCPSGDFLIRWNHL